VRSALERAIQVFGNREWQRITSEVLAEPSPDPLLIPSLTEFKTRAWGEFIRIKHSIPLWNLKSLTGFLFSLPIPHWDLEFRQRGNQEKSLFFHKPLVASGFIAVRWWKSMIEKALDQREISDSEKKLLKTLLGFLIGFETGFSQGVYRKDLVIKFLLSLSKNKRLKQLTVEISPQLLHWFSLQVGFPN